MFGRFQNSLASQVVIKSLLLHLHCQVAPTFSEVVAQDNSERVCTYVELKSVFLECCL